MLFPFLIGCPEEKEPDNYLTIINNTEEEIHLFFNVKSLFDKRGIEGLPHNKIAPKNIYREGFLYEVFENNKLMIFVFVKNNIFKTYSLKEIHDQELYDKRYDLTLEDLEKMDFKIAYLGEEE